MRRRGGRCLRVPDVPLPTKNPGRSSFYSFNHGSALLSVSYIRSFIHSIKSIGVPVLVYFFALEVLGFDFTRSFLEALGRFPFTITCVVADLHMVYAADPEEPRIVYSCDCNKIILEGFRYGKVEAWDFDPDLCCCLIPQAWGDQDLFFVVNVDITQIRFHSY